MLEILDFIGRGSINTARGVVRFLCFLDDILVAAVYDRRRGNRIVNRVFVLQVYFTGVQALPMLTVLAASIGIATTIALLVMLPKIGASEYIGMVAVSVMIRELAPIVTAVMVIVRSGTAMAAELSSMCIEEEISTMRAMEINPIRIFVLPRLFGSIVSVVWLTAYFAVIVILSGYAASSLLLDFPTESYLRDVVAAIQPIDIITSLSKAALFGTIVPLLACYYGLSAQYSSTQIPQMTTKATVSSLVWCFVAGFVIALLTY